MRRAMARPRKVLMDARPAPRRACVRVATALLLAAVALHPAPARAAADATEPESLFVAGRFAAADAGYAARLRAQPGDTLALLRRGGMALMANRLPDARTWLLRALRAGASPARVHAWIAESWYRQDAFDSSAAHLRRTGREAMANKLASFHGHTPNRITGPARDSIPFVQTEPLPTVELWVNGVGPLLFLIDTGGNELLLDPEFADSLHARRFGSESGTFAAGQRRDYEHGAVDSVRLGRFTVHDVPIHVLDTRRMSAAANGARVAGILGTCLLDRFRFGLDYRHGALLLARRGTPPDPPLGRRTVVPFRLAGDHFILARGSVGAGDTVTWMIDTGLAGAAFTAPRATLESAGIAPADTAASTGQGGGGTVRVVPFQVPRLSVGGVERTRLLGMLGPFPPTLERQLGPRVAGIVSHAFFRGTRLTVDLDRMELTIDEED